jgi:hypothetical protein
MIAACLSARMGKDAIMEEDGLMARKSRSCGKRKDSNRRLLPEKRGSRSGTFVS